jgi:hypothetical protein
LSDEDFNDLFDYADRCREILVNFAETDNDVAKIEKIIDYMLLDRR